MKVTSESIATFLVPRIRHATDASKEEVLSRFNALTRLGVRAGWNIATGPLLPFLTKVGVELSIGLAAARGTPILGAVIGFAENIDRQYFPQADLDFLHGIKDLMGMPKATMEPGVCDALENYRE